MKIDEKMVRAFLLREVANCNRRIVGIVKDCSKSNREVYNTCFNDIFFNFGGSRNNQPQASAYEHMSANPKKSYSIYNYFDIDTLIAYRKYLENIINGVDVKLMKDNRRRATSRDLRESLSESRSLLRSRPGEAITGYYDVKRPVVLAKKKDKDGTHLDPVKPLSREVFDKKYDWKECREELKKYISSKHMEEYQEESYDTIEYNYKGVKLVLEVKSRNYYADAEGRGIVSLRAGAKEGMLFGSYYNDGTIYTGDFYNLDGELVESDCGGEYFYENTQEFEKTRKLLEANKSNKKSKEIDGEQLHII